MSTVPVLDTAMLSKMLQLPPARRLALLERALLDGHSLAEALALAQKAERFIAGEHVPAIEMPIQAGTRPVAARRASKPPQSSLLVGDDLHAAIAMFRRGATNAEVGDAFNIENLQQVQGMRLGLGRGGHL